MMRYLIFLVLTVINLLTNLIYANKNTDFQSWDTVVFQTDLNKKVVLSHETQLRFGNDISHLSQSLVRPSIGYKLNPPINNKNNIKHSIWLGYAWVYTDKPFVANNATDEHRIWQQYLYGQNMSKLRLFSRTRLEQRFIESVDKTAWRFRELLRFDYPIFDSHKYFVAVYNEVFLNLNNTSDNRNNQGFRQNRLFLGVNSKLDKNINLDVGYLSQYLDRVGRRDLKSHIFVLTLNVKV